MNPNTRESVLLANSRKLAGKLALICGENVFDMFNSEYTRIKMNANTRESVLLANSRKLAGKLALICGENVFDMFNR